MGCSSPNIIKREKLDQPLKTGLDDVEVDEINQFCESTREIVIEIESIRRALVDSSYEVFLQTGSCVYLKPDLLRSIKCILYKIAADTEGKMSRENTSLTAERPYIECSKSISVYGASSINTLCEYIDAVRQLPSRMHEVKEKSEELNRTAYSPKIELFDLKIGELFNQNKFKIAGLIKKFHKNMSKARKALRLIGLLDTAITEANEQIDQAMELINDDALVENMNRNAELFLDDLVKDSHEVCWPMADVSEKFSSAVKGYNYWNEKIYEVNNFDPIQ